MKRSGSSMPWIISILVLVGALLLIYPTAAAWVSQLNQSAIVAGGVPKAGTFDEQQRKHELALAQEYNDRLVSSATYSANNHIPTSTSGKNLHQLYEQALDAGSGLMGRIQIPSITVDLPIFHGTSDDTLLEGIGHLEGTALPIGGKGTHAVLTGHRGLASATMFTNLNRVKVGDEFTVSTFGRILTYKVIRTQVVNPDQTKSLAPVIGQDLVTLVTCTPLGINSQRIFVTGTRIQPTPIRAQEEATSKPNIPGFPWWTVVLAIVITLDFVYVRFSLCSPVVPRHTGAVKE
jgi:sortase A